VCAVAQAKLTRQVVMTENILSISRVDTKLSSNTLWRLGYMLCAGRNNILTRKSPLVTKQRAYILLGIKIFISTFLPCSAAGTMTFISML
jgi:hypothetical protein